MFHLKIPEELRNLAMLDGSSGMKINGSSKGVVIPREEVCATLQSACYTGMYDGPGPCKLVSRRVEGWF